ILDAARPAVALYVGGMGARGKNFYNDICRAYGFEEAATRVQDLYLDGRKAEAEAAVPTEMLELSHLVGPPGHVRERIAVYQEAGVTALAVNPVGPDAAKTIGTLRTMIDDL
ncbi:MAG TPA: LLM class flavin-dependent oxidoreductase, partial [Iamia sp.]|nr:LLM class flavin-dependent oxidoreductase [Iamia sp.]